MPITCRRALVTIGVVAVASSLGLVALLSPYPRPDFDALKGLLEAVEPAEKLAGDPAATDLALRSSSGLAIRARLRVPPMIRWPAAAVIVLGGLERGREAVDVAAQVVGETPVILASLDYPYLADPSPRGWAIVGALREARPAVYRTVAGARLLVDFLERDPRVRKDRIVLIGVSLGAPIAVAVGGMDRRVAGVASLFGVDFPTMVGQSIRPRVGTLADAMVPLVAWHFRAADALRLASAIPPRPLLVVGGRVDRRIPPLAIEALAAAGAPAAHLVWLDTPHPNPTRPEWLRLGAEVVRAWLVDQGLIGP